MWENTYQIVYDQRDPPVGVSIDSIEVQINEGARLGYMVVSFDAGIEDFAASCLMKCIGCEAVDMGRAPQCSTHQHRKQ